MGSPLCDTSYLVDRVRTEIFEEEFSNYTSGNKFTSVGAGSCALYTTGGVSKVLLSAAATTDNSIEFVRSTGACWALQDNKPMSFYTRLNFASVSTNITNIIFGGMSTTTLTMTDGTDPAASFTGCVIYAKDTTASTRTWCCQSSVGAVKTTSTSSSVATDGTYDLMVSIAPFTSTQVQIVYAVNGLQLKDSVTGQLIKHYATFSGAADMYVAAGIQSGSASGTATGYVDYVAAVQYRGIS